MPPPIINAEGYGLHVSGSPETAEGWCVEVGRSGDFTYFGMVEHWDFVAKLEALILTIAERPLPANLASGNPYIPADHEEDWLQSRDVSDDKPLRR